MLSFSPSLNSKTLENLLQSNSSPAPVSVIAYITPYTQTLQHFNSITSTTVGSLVAQRIFKASVLQMAMSHPYLMHATLAVSAAHLSYLFPASSHPKEHQRNALAVAYHWKSSLKLFRAELNSVQGIRAHNMDPLLSTCMLLAIYSFSLQESTQDSFVYVDTYKSPGTLGWLTAQSGFKGLLIELSEHLNESVWLPVLTDADIDVSTESGVDVNAREDLIADLKGIHHRPLDPERGLLTSSRSLQIFSSIHARNQSLPRYSQRPPPPPPNRRISEQLQQAHYLYGPHSTRLPCLTLQERPLCASYPRILACADAESGSMVDHRSFKGGVYCYCDFSQRSSRLPYSKAAKIPCERRWAGFVKAIHYMMSSLN